MIGFKCLRRLVLCDIDIRYMVEMWPGLLDVVYGAGAQISFERDGWLKKDVGEILFTTDNRRL